MSTINIIKDLRHSFGPIRDQGQRPTCLAFAASDTHAGLRLGWIPLSCEYLFHRTQLTSGRSPNQGAFLKPMLYVLQNEGQPEEGGWPYLQQAPTNLASWMPPRPVGRLYRRDGHQDNVSFNSVVAELDNDFPLILLIKVAVSFYNPEAQGIVRMKNGEKPIDRGHAIVAVGHGSVDSEPAILVRNSWGPHWGDNGYAWLTKSFLSVTHYETGKLTKEL